MEFERERILNGQSVCILAFAEEWAEQECKKLRESGDGLAHWAYSPKLEGMLAELRHAISSNVLKVYDFGRERDYRQSDKAKVEKGHIHVLPRSANAWLEREGFASLALCNDDVCETSNAAAGNSASSPATVTQMGRATEAPPAPADPATFSTTREPTVQKAIAPYVARVMSERPALTGEKLYQYMRRNAGSDGSPFAKLSPGGELFSIEAGANCGLPTVRAALTGYRKGLRTGSRSTVEPPSNS